MEAAKPQGLGQVAQGLVQPSALLKAADEAQLPQRRFLEQRRLMPTNARKNAELRQLNPTVPLPIPTCRVPSVDLVAHNLIGEMQRAFAHIHPYHFVIMCA